MWCQPNGRVGRIVDVGAQSLHFSAGIHHAACAMSKRGSNMVGKSTKYDVSAKTVTAHL